MNKDAKIIIERVKVLFKRIPNTKYTINVANDIYDKQYNFFLESQKRVGVLDLSRYILLLIMI